MGKNAARNTPCYCIGVRRAANSLTKFYDKALAPTGLTVSQFSLLSDIKILRECNKSRLARLTGLERTTVVRNLDVLRGKGYVEETPGKDKRNSLVRLTNSGELAFARGTVLWKTAQWQVKSTLGPENMENLSRILAGLDSINDDGTA